MGVEDFFKNLIFACIKKSNLKGRRARGFLLGFRGFLEIYGYLPGTECHKKAADLVPPVDLGLKGPDGREGTVRGAV